MTMRGFIRLAMLGLACALLTILSACSDARYVLQTADPRGGGGAPPLVEASSLEAWAAMRPHALETLEDTIFGRAPAPAEIRLLDRRIADDAAFGGAGRLEEHVLELSGGELETPVRLTLALAIPANADGPAPVILAPNECGNAFALRSGALTPAQGYVLPYCRSGGFGAAVGGFIFGRHVLTPPAARILSRGYALAAWHESDLSPDRPDLHREALSRFALDPEAQTAPGAVSLWAWTISAVLDHLETDARLDPRAQIAFGHSRRGKAVLLAAARDGRIDAVIAHQSGTGGASLHGDGVGEPVASITQTYPHWFAPAYAGYAQNERNLPVDAHHLLALVAPRPVLLGNAWRDTWSDPAGAFRAAKAASAIYRLYGADGLKQAHLRDFDPHAEIAFHIRPGTHGVTPEDWTAFLDFLDAQALAKP